MNASRHAPTAPPGAVARRVRLAAVARGRSPAPRASSAVDVVVGRLEAEDEQRARCRRRRRSAAPPARRPAGSSPGSAPTAPARARPRRRVHEVLEAHRRATPGSVGRGCTRTHASVITPRMPSEPSSSRSGRRPGAASPAAAATPTRPHGVIARTDSTRSSMCVQTVAKCPPARVAIQPPSVESSNDCGKKRIVSPCSASCASSAGPRDAGLDARRARDRVDLQHAVEARQVERDHAGRSRPATRGSTPPTTLVPPPNGITATSSARRPLQRPPRRRPRCARRRPRRADGRSGRGTRARCRGTSGRRRARCGRAGRSTRRRRPGNAATAARAGRSTPAPPAPRRRRASGKPSTSRDERRQRGRVELGVLEAPAPPRALAGGAPRHRAPASGRRGGRGAGRSPRPRGSRRRATFERGRSPAASSLPSSTVRLRAQHAAVAVGEHDVLAFLAHLAHRLDQQRQPVHARVAVAQPAAVGVDRQRAARRDAAVRDERAALALGAEPQVLEEQDRRDREGVVELRATRRRPASARPRRTPARPDSTAAVVVRSGIEETWRCVVRLGRAEHEDRRPAQRRAPARRTMTTSAPPPSVTRQQSRTPSGSQTRGAASTSSIVSVVARPRAGRCAAAHCRAATATSASCSGVVPNSCMWRAAASA